MRAPVYKRTHDGDPDFLGHFGIHDLLGSVRARDYEAAVGADGSGNEPQSTRGIAEAINWVIIDPHNLD